jgi:hypothetical protein
MSTSSYAVESSYAERSAAAERTGRKVQNGTEAVVTVRHGSAR